VKGHVGDRVVIQGPRVDDHKRIGVITELRHDDGSPPYLVRWLDDGHEGLFFPGPDATIEAPAPHPDAAHNSVGPSQPADRRAL